MLAVGRTVAFGPSQLGVPRGAPGPVGSGQWGKEPSPVSGSEVEEPLTGWMKRQLWEEFCFIYNGLFVLALLTVLFSEAQV